jgi:hypothetical protein
MHYSCINWTHNEGVHLLTNSATAHPQDICGAHLLRIRYVPDANPQIYSDRDFPRCLHANAWQIYHMTISNSFQLTTSPLLSTLSTTDSVSKYVHVQGGRVTIFMRR